MERYKYRARDMAGKMQEGVVEAEDLDEAVRALRQRQYFPVVLNRQRTKAPEKNVSVGIFEQRISGKEIMLFCNQLATLLSSGVSIVSSLKTIRKQMENDRLGEISDDVASSVASGNAFSLALAKYPKVFPKLLVYMVKAGEESGQLDKVLHNYADYLEKKEELKSEVINAMMYPAFLLVLSVGIMIFLMVYILPKFITVLEDAHAKLPLPTRVMVESSKFLQHHYLPLTAGTLVFLISFRLIIRTRSGRRWWDWLKLKLPIFGDVVYKMALVRFSNVFAVLSQSGIPILRGLEISKQVVGNVIFENIVDEIRTNLSLGKRLATEVAKTDFFPPLFVQMISVGEETGKLDNLMEKVSDYYSKEVNNKLKRMVAALEPVMLVVMAFLVGFVALSLVMALMSVLNTIH